MAAVVDGVGVAVGGVTVGALLPVLDAAVSDPEERCATQVDQQFLGVGELGVAPLPVTRGDQVDVGTVDLPGRIGRLGRRHLVEVTGPMHEPVGITTAQMGRPGQAGSGRLRTVDSPHLAGVPTPDQPAPLRFDASRQGAEGDHGVVQRLVVDGVEVDRGELVDRRCQRVDESPSPNHATILSNRCTQTNHEPGNSWRNSPFNCAESCADR